MNFHENDRKAIPAISMWRGRIWQLESPGRLPAGNPDRSESTSGEPASRILRLLRIVVKQILQKMP